MKCLSGQSAKKKQNSSTSLTFIKCRWPELHIWSDHNVAGAGEGWRGGVAGEGWRSPLWCQPSKKKPKKKTFLLSPTERLESRVHCPPSKKKEKKLNQSSWMWVDGERGGGRCERIRGGERDNKCKSVRTSETRAEKGTPAEKSSFFWRELCYFWSPVCPSAHPHTIFRPFTATSVHLTFIHTFIHPSIQ